MYAKDLKSLINTKSDLLFKQLVIILQGQAIIRMDQTCNEKNNFSQFMIEEVNTSIDT